MPARLGQTPSPSPRKAHAPLDRFVARHSPLALVLHDAITRLGPDRYRLIEDYRYPPMLWRLAGGLFRRMPDQVRLSTFLTEDRPAVRTAMLLEKVNGASDLGSQLELTRRLRRHLRDAGRTERDCLVHLLGDSPLGASDGSSWRPTILVVWSGDVTPLESILGVRPQDLPSTLLRAFGRENDGRFAVDRMGRTRDDAGPRDTPTSAEALPAPVPFAPVEPPVARPPAAPAPPLSAQGREPGQTTTAIGNGAAVVHEVVGTLRGSVYRKLLIREMPFGKRFVLLSAGKRPGPAVEQAFFDRVGYADDPIAALRAIATAWPANVRSFAMDVLQDGSFRAATCGVRPLYWRASQRRLVIFPESRQGAGTPTMRVIRGRLAFGDAVLILPRSATGSETEALGDLWNSEAQGGILSPLTARLDAMGVGKALLVSKSG